MGDSIFDTFQSRAAKFEEDLLVSFSVSKESLNSKFTSFLASRNFVSKFKVLSICVSTYLTTFSSFYSYKWFASFYSISLAKLAELSSFEGKLVASYQEKMVSLLLYPLIFQSAKNNITLLTSAATKVVQSTAAKKVDLLSAITK